MVNPKEEWATEATAVEEVEVEAVMEDVVAEATIITPVYP